MAGDYISCFFMPYILSSKVKEGKRKFCMQNKDTGKTYCYGSAEERKKGMQMHEAFSHGFKPTQKGE